jgi:WS/DGAT C-terminal domain
MRRSLLITDFSYQFHRLGDLINSNSSEILIIRGDADIESLSRAVAFEVQRRESFHRRRAFGRKDLDRLEQTATVDSGVTEQFVPAGRADELRALLTANVWTDTSPVDRPSAIRTFCITYGDLRAIQFVTSHLFSDAKAGYQFTADVIRSYNMLRQGKHLHASSAVDWNGALDARMPFFAHVRYFALATTRIARDLVTVERGTTTSAIRPAPRDFLKYSFSKDVLAGAIGRAKRMGVSLHPILVATSVKAWATIRYGDADIEGTYRIADMYSFRHFLKPDIQSIYETLVVPFFPRVILRTEPTLTLREIHSQLDREKHGSIFAELYRQKLYRFLGSVLPSRIAVPMVARFVAKTELVVTNPGIIDFHQDRFGEAQIVDFYSFSQLFPPGRIMIVFNTFLGELRATIIYDTGRFARHEVERLVELMERELESVAKT